MDGYTKLHAVILDSSIWGEPMHIRICWITMLAMADAEGHCEASVGGLARRAQITQEQCREALEVLESPDPDSRDDTAGERIKKVGPGIWHILNHAKYRERQTRRQASQAKWARDKRKRSVDASTQSTHTQTHTQTQVPDNALGSAEHVAEATVPVKGKPKKRAAVPRPDDIPEQVWDDWQAVRKAKKAGPVTATVIKNMATQAQLAQLTVAQAVEECAARGWQAFKADWLKKGFQKPEGKSHAIPAKSHNTDYHIGQVTEAGGLCCDCMSCKAMLRDGRQVDANQNEVGVVL